MRPRPSEFSIHKTYDGRVYIYTTKVINGKIYVNIERVK